jgi:hypothetical protein
MQKLKLGASRFFLPERDHPPPLFYTYVTSDNSDNSDLILSVTNKDA